MKITYSMIALLMLAGCQSHMNQYDAEIAAQQKLVADAQAKVDAEKPKCTKGKELKTLPPKQYFQAVKCVTKLIEDKVIPLTPYPEPMKKFLYTNIENAALYSQGKIMREQLEARGKLAALEMDETIYRQNEEIRKQHWARDEQEKANLVRALQSFEPQRPVYTNCSTFGRTTQCRSQ